MSNAVKTERVLVLGGVSRSLVNFSDSFLKRVNSRGDEVAASTAPGAHSAGVANTLSSWVMRFVPVALVQDGE